MSTDSVPIFKKENDSVKYTWLKHRKRSYFVYLITYFIFGFEVSLTDATMWIYVLKYMDVKDKMLYFGLVTAIDYIPVIALSTVVATYADKSRRISFWMVFLNSITMLGNIVYTLPFSPYFTLFGRFLVGFYRLVRPLIVGEIARSYEREEVSRKIPLCTVVHSIGKASGPLVAMLLTNVDFWLGKLHITYGNVSGLCLFTLVGILQLIILLFHNDISREYDLKAAEEKRIQEICIEKEGEHCDPPEPNSAINVFLKILSHKDTFLIITMTFFSNIWDRIAMQVIPIIVSQTLHYSINISNMCFVAYAVVTGIIVFVLTRTNVNKYLYYYGVISLISSVINYICLRLISDHFNYSVNMGLLIVYSLFLSIGDIGDDIFLVVTFTKLVSGTHQCFGEGVRDTASRLGSLLGAAISAYIYYNINISFLVVNFISILMIIWLVLRKKTLRDPQTVIW